MTFGVFKPLLLGGKNMGRLFRVLFLATAGLALLAGGCKFGARGVPVEPDLTGAKIVVWDADQVALHGAASYREEAARVVGDFSAKYKTSVDLVFVDRGVIQRYLAGERDLQSLGEGLKPPDVVFTGERPFVPTDAAEVHMYLEPEGYLEAALEYWRREGRLMAVPAYIHWWATGCVARPVEGSGGAEGTEMSYGRTAYILDSGGLLTLALELTGDSWEADGVAAFLSYVKEKYGPPLPDPLGSFMQGTVDALYPVTPFLLKWMEGCGRGEVRPIPIGNPFGDARFYFTVPGYVVLAQGGVQKECASRLARDLAANLGRWVARAAGGLPARSEDISVFSIESGFNYEERMSVLSCLTGQTYHAPLASDFISRQEIDSALRPIASDYLSGKIGESELRSGIQEILRRHTKP